MVTLRAQTLTASQTPLLVCLAGVIGGPVLSTALTTGQGDFALGLLGLAVCALYSNWAARQGTAGGDRQRFLSVFGGLIVLPLLLVAVHPTMIMPVEVYGEQDAGLTVALTWLVLLAGFFAGTPELRLPVALPVVPGLSAFGLNASKTFGVEIVYAFGLFVFATIGLLVFDAFRHHAARGLLPTRAGEQLLQRQYVLIGGWGGVVAMTSLLLWPLLTNLTPELMMVGYNLLQPESAPRVPLPNYGSFNGALELSGGSYEFNDTIWMRVRSPLLGTKWRGRVLTEYDGRTWSPTPTGAVERAERQGEWWQVQNAPPQHQVVREEFQPAVNMPAILYASGEPLRVRCEQPVYLNPVDGSPRVRRLMARGRSYVVHSAVPSASPSTLVTANVPPPAAVADAYLKLPVQLPALERLAREATVGESTPLRKAEALKRYLDSTCLYSLRSPSLPRDEDAVTHFVTVSREGACDLFASAQVVMCRLVGVPARLVTGFQDSGERERGWAIVRERDAHAWAEVYVAPHGWIPIDPTDTSVIDPGTLQLLAQNFSRTLVVPALLLRWLPAALVALLLCGLLKRVAANAGTVAATPGLRISRSYLAACHSLARRGFHRTEVMTPWEFEQTVIARAELTAVRDEFSALTAMAVQAAFMPEAPTVADASRAQELAQAVRRRR